MVALVAVELAQRSRLVRCMVVTTKKITAFRRTTLKTPLQTTGRIGQTVATVATVAAAVAILVAILVADSRHGQQLTCIVRRSHCHSILVVIFSVVTFIRTAAAAAAFTNGTAVGRGTVLIVTDPSKRMFSLMNVCTMAVTGST